MSTSPPQVNAFVLCDQAFQQAGTGKWCIIGTFSVIWAREFPCTHSPLTVFVGLSDFSGPALVQVSLRDENGTVVAAVRGQIPKIPMAMIELGFPFPPVKFEREGTYTAELLENENLLCVRSFRVMRAPVQPPLNPPLGGPS